MIPTKITGANLTSGQLLVGNSAGQAADVALSGDATLSNAGALTIAANAVEASMLGTNLGKGFIPLNLDTLKIISGDAFSATTEAGIPDTNTSPSMQRINGATDKAGRIAWAASSSVEVQFAPFVYPPDLDDTAAVEVHLLAAMAGATDIPTIAVSYWEGVGDTNAGGNTAAVTGTALTEYSVSITAANVGTHPNMASVGLTPAAHTTDILYLYGAWIEYTRKS